MNSSYLDTVTRKFDTDNRKNLERSARPLNILFSMILVVFSGVLCFVGAFTGGLSSLAALPLSTTVLMLGIVLSLMTVPQLALQCYYRTLLGEIRELEKQVEELKHDA